MTKRIGTTFQSDAHISDAYGTLQVYHYSPDALWDVPILMNSILYMYLRVLLKYNARVAARAEQLKRRMS
jgi:hypothetical protein